ncbi:hypothetical protein AB0G02_26515 [Actinosynnema sp. NPDC023658]|uniref:hypothetical protein n=1 Tax=Actinosynnema sp. NPDC023658 TaxID=3155465 RepID=UPI0033CECDDB
MPSPAGHPAAEQGAAARRVAEDVVRRAELYEAVGIVRGGVGGGDPTSADERFSARYDDAQCTVEAARMAAIVDAAAEGRADPDWGGGWLGTPARRSVVNGHA